MKLPLSIFYIKSNSREIEIYIPIFFMAGLITSHFTYLFHNYQCHIMPHYKSLSNWNWIWISFCICSQLFKLITNSSSLNKGNYDCDSVWISDLNINIDSYNFISISIFSLLLISVDWEDISNTQDSAWPHLQTPPSSSKTLCCASSFQLSYQCLVVVEQGLSCLIYYYKLVLVQLWWPGL